MFNQDPIPSNQFQPSQPQPNQSQGGQSQSNQQQGSQFQQNSGSQQGGQANQGTNPPQPFPAPVNQQPINPQQNTQGINPQTVNPSQPSQFPTPAQPNPNMGGMQSQGQGTFSDQGGMGMQGGMVGQQQSQGQNQGMAGSGMAAQGGGMFGDDMFPVPPAQQPKPEDTTPANYQLGILLPAELKVTIPPHELSFDEKYFLRLLAGSISLSKDEKKRIVESVPKLRQSQIDELVRIFEEEKEKFAQLSAKHVPQLEKLAKQHYQDWMDLETEQHAESKKKDDDAKADEIRKQLGL